MFKWEISPIMHSINHMLQDLKLAIFAVLFPFLFAHFKNCLLNRSVVSYPMLSSSTSGDHQYFFALRTIFWRRVWKIRKMVFPMVLSNNPFHYCAQGSGGRVVLELCAAAWYLGIGERRKIIGRDWDCLLQAVAFLDFERYSFRQKKESNGRLVRFVPYYTICTQKNVLISVLNVF